MQNDIRSIVVLENDLVYDQNKNMYLPTWKDLPVQWIKYTHIKDKIYGD